MSDDERVWQLVLAAYQANGNDIVETDKWMVVVLEEAHAIVAAWHKDCIEQAKLDELRDVEDGRR